MSRPISTAEEISVLSRKLARNIEEVEEEIKEKMSSAKDFKLKEFKRL